MRRRSRRSRSATRVGKRSPTREMPAARLSLCAERSAGRKRAAKGQEVQHGNARRDGTKRRLCRARGGLHGLSPAACGAARNRDGDGERARAARGAGDCAFGRVGAAPALRRAVQGGDASRFCADESRGHRALPRVGRDCGGRRGDGAPSRAEVRQRDA